MVGGCFAIAVLMLTKLPKWDVPGACFLRWLCVLKEVHPTFLGYRCDLPLFTELSGDERSFYLVNPMALLEDSSDADIILFACNYAGVHTHVHRATPLMCKGPVLPEEHRACRYVFHVDCFRSMGLICL